MVDRDKQIYIYNKYKQTYKYGRQTDKMLQIESQGERKENVKNTN